MDAYEIIDIHAQTWIEWPLDNRVGVWIAAGTPVQADRYPCRCTMEPWQKRCNGYQNDGHCPCRGRMLEDWLPRACCAHTTQKAPKASVTSLLWGPPVDTAPAVPVSPSRQERPRRAIETAQVDLEHPVLPPHPRRWSREELHCGCSTPWDGQKTTAGYHCTGCCQNFQSLGVASLHSRRIGNCKHPRELVDVDTGARLLTPRMLNGHTVWGVAS